MSYGKAGKRILAVLRIAVISLALSACVFQKRTRSSGPAPVTYAYYTSGQLKDSSSVTADKLKLYVADKDDGGQTLKVKNLTGSEIYSAEINVESKTNGRKSALFSEEPLPPDGEIYLFGDLPSDDMEDLEVLTMVYYIDNGIVYYDRTLGKYIEYNEDMEPYSADEEVISQEFAGGYDDIKERFPVFSGEQSADLSFYTGKVMNDKDVPIFNVIYANDSCHFYSSNFAILPGELITYSEDTHIESECGDDITYAEYSILNDDGSITKYLFDGFAEGGEGQYKEIRFLNYLNPDAKILIEEIREDMKNMEAEFIDSEYGVLVSVNNPLDRDIVSMKLHVESGGRSDFGDSFMLNEAIPAGEKSGYTLAENLYDSADAQLRKVSILIPDDEGNICELEYDFGLAEYMSDGRGKIKIKTETKEGEAKTPVKRIQGGFEKLQDILGKWRER